MRVLSSILVTAALGFGIAACSEGDAISNKTSSEKEYTITEVEVNETLEQSVALFAIEGMTCQMGCVSTVNKALRGMEGVSLVEIDFDENNTVDIAKVSYDAKITNPVEMAEKIESLARGAYQVVEITVQKQKVAEKAPQTQFNDKQNITLSIPNVFEGVISAITRAIPR
ncbi:MAG: heavy-metal-associated domain-containing protein [Luteibaculaceae bacterium]